MRYALSPVIPHSAQEEDVRQLVFMIIYFIIGVKSDFGAVQASIARRLIGAAVGFGLQHTQIVDALVRESAGAGVVKRLCAGALRNGAG